MKNKNSHYLIHLPHCGTQIPAEYLDDYLLSKDELNYNIFQYADLYTDELFASLYDKYDGVKSQYSRLFIDPERFGDDEFETLSIGVPHDIVQILGDDEKEYHLSLTGYLKDSDAFKEQLLKF